MKTIKGLEHYAEVALVGVSMATVLGFSRLFVDYSYFWRLTAFVIGSHAIAVAGRRLKWSVGAVAAVSLIGVVVVAAIVLYPSTTVFGIPTADTISAMRSDLASAYSDFQSVRAPAPVTPAFLLAGGVALWWAAFIADWAAFRLWVGFESIVPTGSVFVFASLFSATDGRVFAAALFIGAALGFLLIHKVAHEQATGGWVSAEGSAGPRAMLRVGGTLIVLSVIAAAIIGPHLPQAEAQALYEWRGDGSGPSSRVTVSPLVEIHKRLVDQSTQELFTVHSNQRSYWRLTSLDHFDGNVWSSNGTYEKAAGSLPAGIDSSAPTQVITQQFEISALASIWLPAAFEAQRVDAGDANVRWEASSGTLIVGNNEPTSDGLGYTVQSVAPVYDPGQLSQAPPDVPADIADVDEALPADFHADVTALALQITANAATPYEKALALQSYFRDNFTYDQTVPEHQSNNDIADFLASKRGYCEQFAGTYAAMARAIHLPSRVAVGFTPGELDPVDPTLYHVQGIHAHAWPEVYIQGQGWVLFEPTPTRGAPNAVQYTGVPEEQASATGAPTTVVTTITTPATSAPAAGEAGATPTTKPREGDADQASSSDGFLSGWRRTALYVVAALLVLGGAYAIAMPYLHRRRRQRRRDAATEPTEQVRVAWKESVESIALLGVAPMAAETAAEFAERAEPLTPEAGWDQLAGALVAADFSIEGVDEQAGLAALARADVIDDNVRAQVPTRQRWLSDLDPRPPGRPRMGPGARRRSRARLGRRDDSPSIDVVPL